MKLALTINCQCLNQFRINSQSEYKNFLRLNMPLGKLPDVDNEPAALDSDILEKFTGIKLLFDSRFDPGNLEAFLRCDLL